MALKVGQNFVRMLRWGHRVIALGDLAVGADQNGNALRPLGFRRGGAIGDGCGFRQVGQKIVGEVEFLLERPVLRCRIETASQYYAILGLKVLDSVTEPVALNRSTACVCFRVPPDQHMLASKIGERHGRAVLVRQAEAGSVVADVDHGLASFH